MSSMFPVKSQHNGAIFINLLIIFINYIDFINELSFKWLKHIYSGLLYMASLNFSVSRLGRKWESVCGIDGCTDTLCVYACAVRGHHSGTSFLGAELSQNQELTLVGGKSLSLRLHNTPPSTVLSGVHTHSGLGFFYHVYWCMCMFTEPICCFKGSSWLLR